MIKIKNIFISILFIFLLCGMAFGLGLSFITKSDIKVSKDGADDYILTSLPQEIRDSQEFEYLNKIGAINCVFTCRENGKWDKEFMIMSRHHPNSPLLENAKKQLRSFIDLCDKAIPNEKILAICYYADYGELIIYLHPDQWKNKEIYEEVAEKLNNALKGVDK